MDTLWHAVFLTAFIGAGVLIAAVFTWEALKALGRASKHSWLTIFSGDYRQRRRSERAAAWKALEAAQKRDREWWVWVESERERYTAAYNVYLQDLDRWRKRHPDQAQRGGRRSWADATNHYGDEHQALRAAWKDVIRAGGAECRETICVMPSRRIDKGAPSLSWHLAHDHTKGGAFDYLGPAHAQCNEAESLARGNTWEGAPSLAELLSSVSYEGTGYDAALKRLSDPEPMPEPPTLHPDHPDHRGVSF